MTRKSAYYQRAARRIASQKVFLAKTVAEQKHAKDFGIPKSHPDVPALRRILKNSEARLARLAVARKINWTKVRDELDRDLNRFDMLANAVDQTSGPDSLSLASNASDASSTRSKTRSKPAAPP